MALIRRSIIKPVLEATQAGKLALVSGPPRCGKTVLADQLAKAGRGVVFNARRREGRALVEAAKAGKVGALLGGAGFAVIDDASESDAEAIEAWLGSSGTAGTRFALIGGPFGEGGVEARWGAAAVGGGAERGNGAAGSGDAARAEMRLRPLSLFEAGASAAGRLWYRGGFPEAFSSPSDEAALEYLEEYAARMAFGGLWAWGMPADGKTAIMILEALAASGGGPFNENAAARALGTTRPTVARYLGAFASAGLVIELPAFIPGGGKGADRGSGGADRSAGHRFAEAPARVSSSAALYVADPGLLHALGGARGPAAGPEAAKALAASRAASWTAFVVAQAAAALPAGAELRRYASADGAAMDLVAVRDGRPVLAAAARRHRPVSLERSISYAAAALFPGPPRGSAQADSAGSADEAAAGARNPVKLVVSPDGDGRSLGRGFASVDAAAFAELLSRA